MTYTPYSQASTSLLGAMQTEDERTLNDCVTHSTTGNPLVDMFFQMGAMRGKPNEMLIRLMTSAFSTNQLDAMKLFFWARDVRGGAGERQSFRTLLQFMSQNPEYHNVLRHNLSLIPVYGRWDDVLVLFGTPLENDTLEIISKGLTSNEGLCAKWMPREKSSKKEIAQKIRKHMGLSPKKYRKLLSDNTSVVETAMCSKDWSSISYGGVPSIAMKNYRKCFERQDSSRWNKYLHALEAGEEKVNASAIFPHNIVLSVLNNIDHLGLQEKRLLNQQWLSLPNYMEGNTKRILPVVDTSGSMYSGYNCNSSLLPIHVSLSLGLYIAERNEGPFKDHFMTFSSTPIIQKVAGNDIQSKLVSLKNADWGYNTNIEAVFDRILDTAIKWQVSADQMPTTVLILSDMEFDRAAEPSETAYQAIAQKWERAGYSQVLPEIVFWNLDAKSSNFPVKFDQRGSAMISGFSPSILKQLLSGSDITPEGIMRATINSDRYSIITLP